MINGTHAHFERNIGDKILEIKVKMNDTIKDVVIKIANCGTNLLEHCITLVYSGILLDKEKTVGYYNVIPNSKLFAIISLRSS